MLEKKSEKENKEKTLMKELFPGSLSYTTRL